MIKNKITLNVLANISRQINKEDDRSISKKVLVLLNGSNMRLDDRLEEIKKLAEKEIGISLGFSFMGEGILERKSIINKLNPSLVYGEEDIFQLEKILDENPILLMPNLTINTLSKVGSGMIDSFASTLLWTYLYQGKDVYLDFNSVRNYLGKETENQAIKNLLDKHIGTIKDMGALEVKKGDYLKRIVGNQVLVKEASNIDLAKDKKTSKGDNSRQILTEKDVEKISKGSILSLPKGSILTPLAKDRIRDKNIQIEIKE